MSKHKSDPFTGKATPLPPLTGVRERAKGIDEHADQLGVPQRQARKVLDNPDKHSIGGTRIA